MSDAIELRAGRLFSPSSSQGGSTVTVNVEVIPEIADIVGPHPLQDPTPAPPLISYVLANE